MSLPQFHMIPGAPAPVAPFSHAVEIDGWIFVTGQLPLDPEKEGAALPPDVETQTRTTMANLITVLGGLKLTLEHVVTARCFLTEFERDYARFNAVYASCFPSGRYPARTCIGVTALARGALVEVDFIARRT